MGDPPKIKSEVFLCGKMTLMKILMSFNEDREEEREEDVEFR
jgi:hypothetical protein